MTIKEVKKLYDSIELRIASLETQISNHSGQHFWDRIVNYAQLTLMIVVILLLKFKLL